MRGKETGKANKIVLAATSDLHLPIGPYREFLESIKNIEEVDLFLIAGDAVDKGRYIFLRKLENDLRRFSCPKIMVRGNNEYSLEETKKFLKEIILLEDDAVSFEIKGKKVLIVGTQGITDRPNPWVRKNIPDFKRFFDERFRKIKELSKLDADVKILLSHYSVTFLNKPKDPKKIWKYLGSERWFEILDRFDVVIHGHVHYGETFSKFGRTRIYNVSIYQNRKVVLIEV